LHPRFEIQILLGLTVALKPRRRVFLRRPTL